MAVGTATIIGLSIMGGLRAWEAYGQKKAGDENEAAFQFNASVARMQAADALVRGAEAEERFRQGVQVLIGSQRASFAGQNVDVGIGSPLDVTADTAYLGELDALTIRNNAAREAWGYEVQAKNFDMNANIANRQGNFAAAGTLIGFGASLLSLRYGGAGGGASPNRPPSLAVQPSGTMPSYMGPGVFG